MKKFLSLVVAALLSVSAVTTASAAKFTDVDVKDEALTDAVELLTALNVTKGTSDTEFGTAQNVTREQMAAFIYRMMKAGKSVEGGVNTTSFTDLEDPTFYFMVSWANSQGIIKGRSATSFDPKGGITLQDAYTMIVRALGYDDGTLAYPIGYISLAEDLGLDEDLPSTLNYTDTLTRGNVAIILANMFYAETAEVEIKYESDPYYHEESGEWFEGASKPVEYHKTVAEAIFEVEKISRRVVATPNYSFDNVDKPNEDVEMVVLRKVNADDDTVTFPTEIEFADLGLDGAADDYFLNDIVMFVRDIGTQKEPEYEIFGATATGTKTTVSFADVEFGTVSGSTKDKYYDEDKEHKLLNGKITLGDIVTYVAKAPYSYTKDGATLPEFITLGGYDGDMKSEDEADHIKFNYVIDTNASVDPDKLGSLVGFDAREVEENNTKKTEYDKNVDAYLAQLYFGGAGEIDVIDCDGDNKPEYLFVKNYVVGTIDDTEEESVTDLTETNIADVDAKSLEIKIDYSIVDGEAEDGDIVLAYVNPTANYVKIAEVLTGKEASITTAATKYFALSTGEKIYYKDAQSVVLNGAANGLMNEEPDVVNFDKEATYYFTADGKLVYVTGLETAIALDSNYVVVLEEGAFQTSTMVDGKLEKAYYITIYNDGVMKSVKALSIDGDDKSATKKYTNNIDPENEDNFEETPETVKCNCEVDHGDYCYKDYVNKLATGKSTSKGAYYFRLLDTDKHSSREVDVAKLTSTDAVDKDNSALEFRVTGVNSTFTQKTGNVYELSDLENTKIKGVYIQDYTQIIIRSRDEDGEWTVDAYGKDNLPDINEETIFTDVTYVLVNNRSTTYENLAVFYGVIDDELEGATGEMAEVRVIRGYSKSSTDDGTLYTYDVFNPLTGKVETGVEGIQTDGTGFTKEGQIVALTTEGYINDEASAAGNVYDKGYIYNIDHPNKYKFEDYGTAERALGYVEVVEYDDTTKYLITNSSEYENAFLQVTDATVVSLIDQSGDTIKVVDADVLGSTSKTYRWGDDKNINIRVFVGIEESADYEDEEPIYDVLFAMIVRD